MATASMAPAPAPTIKLSFVVSSAVKTLQQRREAAHHRFIISVPEEPVMIRADLPRMTRLLLLMLTDAMSHTEPGRPIRLTARRAGAEGILETRSDGPDHGAERIVRLPVAV